MTKINVSLLPYGRMPTRAHESDAGWDFYAPDDLLLLPHFTTKVMSGVRMEIPEGWFGDVRPRSSLFSVGINCAGTIDSGYRGEIGIMLYNSTDYPRPIKRGDRIAQIVILPYAGVQLELTDRLSGSDRGEGGFGSSGA